MNIKKTIIFTALGLLLSNAFNSGYSSDDTKDVNAPNRGVGSASSTGTQSGTSILQEDRSESTLLILNELKQIPFSAALGTCADVFKNLEHAIAESIFEVGDLNSMKNILETVDAEHLYQLHGYRPVLNIAFNQIVQKVKDTTNNRDVIDSLLLLTKAYRFTRASVEAIWEDRDPRSQMDDVAHAALRDLYLQTEECQKIFFIAPSKVKAAYRSHKKKYHPNF